jgi:hypothetical protein
VEHEQVFEGIPGRAVCRPRRDRRGVPAQPPDDEIVLLDGDGTYAWAGRPEVPAGQLFLTERDSEIARLVIRYDR